MGRDPNEFGDADGAESSANWNWLKNLARLDADDALLKAEGAAALGLPRTIGKFRLESLLGRGGFGAVFRAYDTALDRYVALKLAWPQVMLGRTSAQRFVDGAKIAGQLSHPGIVPIYNSDSIGSIEFIEMELIDGPSLAAWLKQHGPAPIDVAVGIIATVAEAVEFAHRQGIIHRDLKPGNTLLRPTGGGGRFPYAPLVSDFDLAHRRRRADESKLTGKMDVLGTEPYMAPELGAGSEAKSDVRSDVYSLGVMLYELITGRTPPKSPGNNDHPAASRFENLSSLRTLRSKDRRKLEAILQACMEADPARRYASARELARDLRRYAASEPISLRPPGAWARLVMKARRRPATTVATVALAVLTFAAGMTWKAWQSERETEQAKLSAVAQQVASNEAKAQSAEWRALQHDYANAIQAAARSLKQGSRRESLRSLSECRKLFESRERLGIEWHLLSAMNEMVDHEFFCHPVGTLSVAFSPDSRLMYSGGTLGEIISWNTETWTKERPLRNPGGVKALAVSSDGTLLAAAGYNGHVTVFRTADGVIVYDERCIAGRVFDVAWLGNSNRLAAGGEDAVLLVIDPSAQTKQVIGPLVPSPEAVEFDPTHPSEIVGLSYLASSKKLAVLKAPSEILFFDPATMQQTDRWNGENVRSTGQICEIPVGPGYLALGRANHVRICSLEDGGEVGSLHASSIIEQLRYHAEGDLLVACCRDGAVQTWNTAAALAGKSVEPSNLPGHKGRGRCVGVSSDGRWLAAGSNDGRVRIWEDFQRGGAADLPLEHKPDVVQFSPCGRWLGMVERAPNTTSMCSVFAVETGERLWQKTVSALPEKLKNLVFDPAGEMVALKQVDGSLRGHDAQTGEIRTVYLETATDIDHFWFRADGRLVCSSSTRLVLTARDQQPAEELPMGEGAAILGNITTPAGELWLEGDSRNNIRMTEQPFGPIVRRFGGMASRPSLAVVSPDGQHLAAWDTSQVVYLWDTFGEPPASRLIGHEASISALQVAPDSQTLLSQSYDGTVRLWHIATRAELLSIGSRKELALCMAVHPMGKLLVVGMKADQQYALRIYRLGWGTESLLAKMAQKGDK